MSEKISVRVQHKRMTASQWNSSNIILLEGELGIESDTGNVKVGDGRSRYSALKYLTGPKGDRGFQGERGPQGIQGVQGPKGDRGLTGERGPQGVQGPKGQDGTMRFEDLTSAQKATLKGDRGPQGERGYTGAQGPQGDRGPQGERGLTGPQGPQGQQGIQGVNIIKHKGDIGGDGSPGLTITVYRNMLQPSDIAKVGDIVFDQYSHENGVDIDFWRITSINSSTVQLAGLSKGFVIPRGPQGAQGERGVNGAPGARGADGRPGQNIINQNGGQELKYWAGTMSQYNSLSTKDANTIYDIIE